MHQLRELFRRLTWRQRILLATVAIAVFGGLYWFSRWSAERDFKPLFTNMSPEDAGGVTAKLKELSVEYRLKDEGSSIHIHSDRVAEVRLQLAAAGLPRSGRIGFELFDKTNFGASEFTEQVNYQRAVEGELERSVMSIREVETARVHITPAKDSIYLESRQPAKASVLVKLKRGAKFNPQNIAAISQLAASAVPSLSADQVSVMDTDGNLLTRAKARGVEGGETSEAVLEYRKTVEREIQNKIVATLDPLLGTERYRVGVSADVDLTSGETNEETYDPQKSAVVNSQKTDDGPVGTPATAGVPGTASNVPNPTARTGTGASTTNYSRRTENVTYQPSRTVKRTKIPQGAILRLSLSILLDHTLRWEGAKRVIEAPSAEKLMVIRDVVAAATGLNMERGDQLVVDAFPFEATLTAEPLNATPTSVAPAAPVSKLPAWLENLLGQKNAALIAGIGSAATLLLIGGGLFYWRRSRKKKTAAQIAAELESGKVRGIDAGEQLGAKLAEHAGAASRKSAEALLAMKLPEVATKKTDVLKKHIAEEIVKNPQGLAHVVRSWLNGEYQR